MHADEYSFKDKLITLIDQEMDLHFQEAYDPVLVPAERKVFSSLGKEHILVRTRDDAWVAEKNGHWDGQYLQFYPNGAKKIEAYYLDGILHGPSIYFADDGKVLSQSWFIKGLQQGKAWQFYANGQLYSLQRFFDNHWHGTQEYFYANGKVKTMVKYVYGKLHGKPHLFPPIEQEEE